MRILTRLSISILFLGVSMTLAAQNLTHLGVLPKVNYLKPINNHWSMNFTAFSEIDVADNNVGSTEFPSKVINLSFVGGVAYKLKLNTIVTGGYLFRFIDPFENNTRTEHRLIAQVVQLQHFESLRIRHHLKFEERFIEAANDGKFDAITRLSYSLGWDIPLQGKHLNTNEFYLNSVSTYYAQPTRPRTAVNNLTEFYLGLGYKTEKLGRFEIGPEAKLGVRNTQKDLNTIIYIDFVWYPSFKKKTL